MQRFGNGAVPTHRVGEQILKKQWNEALLSILNVHLEEIMIKVNLSTHEEVLTKENIEKGNIISLKQSYIREKDSYCFEEE